MKARIRDALLAAYRNRKRKQNNNSPAHALKTVRALLKQANYGFYVSQGDDGWCSSRYVQPIVEWDKEQLQIWVGTSATSRKVAETAQDNKVVMAFGNDKAGAHVVVYASAAVSTDIALCQRYWQPAWKLFFPQGPESGEMAMLALTPERIEVIDLKHNIAPDPFGLKSLVMTWGDGCWQVSAA